MPRIAYIDKRFSAASLAIILQANKIIEEYQAEGFDLTLRQLYYQFVSRDLIENKQSEYNKLGVVINNARLAGFIDWNSIVDRTRNLKSNSHWDSPKEIIETCAGQFQIDKWENQEYRIEVWIEKDALIGVIENVCRQNDVGFFSCRGYTSQSEMWGASQRLLKHAENGQEIVIIHLGDHDSSGIDMTRDIDDRLNLFTDQHIVTVNRIALNMDQVEKYDPPPNPAKITDPRAKKYIQKFGQSSWELDALEPRLLEKLIQKTINQYKDDALWEKMIKKENRHINKLKKVAKELK